MDSFADRYHGAMARNWDIRADFAEAEEQRDDWIPFLEGLKIGQNIKLLHKKNANLIFT